MFHPHLRRRMILVQSLYCLQTFSTSHYTFRFVADRNFTHDSGL